MGEEKCILILEKPINPDRLIGFRITSLLVSSSFCWGETLLVSNTLQKRVVNLLAAPATSAVHSFVPLVLGSGRGELRDPQFFPCDPRPILVTSFPLLGWRWLALLFHWDAGSDHQTITLLSRWYSETCSWSDFFFFLFLYISNDKGMYVKAETSPRLLVLFCLLLIRD